MIDMCRLVLSGRFFTSCLVGASGVDVASSLVDVFRKGKLDDVLSRPVRFPSVDSTGEAACLRWCERTGGLVNGGSQFLGLAQRFD
jgi:hypothetical protein